MSEVWETLIEIQDRLIDAFDATGTEVEEPGMDRFVTQLGCGKRRAMT